MKRTFLYCVITGIVLVALHSVLSAQDKPLSEQSSEAIRSAESLNADLQMLAPYFGQPGKKLSATIKVERALSATDVYVIPKSARITDLWFGAEINGQTLQSSRRVADGEDLKETLEAFRAAVDAMAPILERTKPDPTIVIPKGSDYGIQAITVEGNASEIIETRRLIPNGKIERLVVEGAESATPKVQKRPSAKAHASRAAVVSSTPRKFLPNEGRVYVGSTLGSDNREYRYVSHWVRWDNNESIQDFSPDDVYEHQLVLLKTRSGPGGTYLKEFGEFVRPQWNASWVGGYLDTQILNNHEKDGKPDEADFTIGTYYPRMFLKAGQWYSLWALFEKGDISSNEAKLTGQVRTLSPNCPFGTAQQYYCVGLTPSGATQWIINAKKLSVPTAERHWFRPQITSLQTLTTATANEQFFIRINGGGLGAGSLRVVVTGPGCGTYGTCKVPITVVRQAGKVTATQLERVPLTLAAGSYKVYVDNGEAFTRQPESEGWPLSVNPRKITSPAISAADYMSAPLPGKQFIMRIKGQGFEPARVRIVVTGPGCSSFGTCVVSNSVLRAPNFALTSAIIERVPLTLSTGSYLLYVQNGASLRDPVSQPTTVTVLAPAPVNPSIDKVKFLAPPVGGKQFFVTIDGKTFDINLIRVVVTGPGCTNFGSCVVSNKVLKDFGKISGTQLSKVPLTLDAGKFKVFVQNAASGNSRASAGYVIDVNVPPLELTRVKPQTTPKGGKQFISQFEGRSFDKSRIRVVVTGPGCQNFGMCVVSNKVIKDFGSISATKLSKVPMKLAAGKYKVYVQNGTSLRDPISNSYSLTVK